MDDQKRFGQIMFDHASYKLIRSNLTLCLKFVGPCAIWLYFPLADENRRNVDRWSSVEEIAEYLGVSKDTVYAWISRRNMPAHRIGRLWKSKTDEVDEWVRSGGAAENESRGKE